MQFIKRIKENYVLFHTYKRLIIFAAIVILAYLILLIIKILLYPELIDQIYSNIKFCENPLLLGIFSGILSAIILIPITFFIYDYANFYDAVSPLLQEISKNMKKFEGFSKDINEIRFSWDNKKLDDWIPKQNSFTEWKDGRNFQYKYFSSTEFFYFSIQGFLRSNGHYYNKNALKNLYLYFMDFSTNLQIFENNIHKLMKNPQNPFTFKLDKENYLINSIDEAVSFLNHNFRDFYSDKILLEHNNLYESIRPLYEFRNK